MSRAPPSASNDMSGMQPQQYALAGDGQMHPPPQTYPYRQPPPQTYAPGYPPGPPMSGWRDGSQPPPGQPYQQPPYGQHQQYSMQQQQPHQQMPPPRPHPLTQNITPTVQSPQNGWTSYHPAASASAPIVKRESPGGGLANFNQLSMPPPPVVAAEAQPAPSGGGEKAGPSEFIKKLYNMLEEESVQYGINNGGKVGGDKKGKGRQERGAVGWGRGGQTFVVWEMNEFTTKVLPHTFRHSNFSSFVRQLNKYGFSKIKHVDEVTGQIKENVWEFQHPSFQSGGRTDLDSIKRKAAAPKKAPQVEPPALLTTAVNPASPSTGGSRLVGGYEGRSGMNTAWIESKLQSLEDRVRKAEAAATSARSREADWRAMIGEVIGYLVTTEQEPSQGASGLLHQYNSIYRRHCGELAGVPMYPYNPPAGGPSSRPLYYHGQATYGASGEPITGTQTQASPASASGSGSGGSQAGPSPRVPEESSASGGKRSGGLESSLNGETYGTGQRGVSFSMLAPGRPRGASLFDEQGMPFSESFGGDQWIDGGAGSRKESMGTTIRMLLATNNAREQDEGQDPLDNSPRVDTITTGLTPSSSNSPFGVLELAEDAPTQTRHAFDRIRRSTIIPSWTTPPKVLVVEDDLVYRQLSRKFLEKFGCEIETVEDARQALEKMNERKFDLVLMDIFLGPHMDGRKATSLIRQFDSLTPIISMTSNAQPNDVISYLEHGMTDVLAKPFTKRGLFTILEKHLIHLKAIQQLADIPRFVGVPPLSDSGVIDAVATGAAQFVSTGNTAFIRNPLAGMGVNDDTYRLMLQNYIAVGVSDPSTIDLSVILPSNGLSASLNGQSGSLWEIPGETRHKRGIEEIDDEGDWKKDDSKKHRPVEVS